MRMIEKEYVKFCKVQAYVKPQSKKKIVDLSKKLGISQSEIVCNILEKHLITLL